MATRIMPSDIAYIRAALGDNPPPSAARYPWDEWADGNTWHLVEGDDYHTSTDNFIDTAKKWARRHGQCLRRRRATDGLYIRFIPKEPAT